MSKESQIKKKARNNASKNANRSIPQRPKLTDEEKARIIKDSLAKRPVVIFRYPNGKLNKKFIIALALLIIALGVSLFFLTR